jgi:hypothetical protein
VSLSGVGSVVLVDDAEAITTVDRAARRDRLLQIRLSIACRALRLPRSAQLLETQPVSRRSSPPKSAAAQDLRSPTHLRHARAPCRHLHLRPVSGSALSGLARAVQPAGSSSKSSTGTPTSSSLTPRSSMRVSSCVPVCSKTSTGSSHSRVCKPSRTLALRSVVDLSQGLASSWTTPRRTHSDGFGKPHREVEAE